MSRDIGKNKNVDESYYHATGDNAMRYASLPEILDKRAKDNPNDECHVFRVGVAKHEKLGRVSMTFGDLAFNSLYLAAAMLELGIKEGDHIIVVGYSSPEYVVLEFACMRIKVVLVKIPPDMAHVKTVMKTLVKYKCRAVILDFLAENPHLDNVIDTLYKINSSKDVNKRARFFALRAPQDQTLDILELSEMIDDTKDPNPVWKIQETIAVDDVAVVIVTKELDSFLFFAKHSHFGIVNNTMVTEGQVVNSLSDRYFNDKPFWEFESNIFTPIVLGIAMVHLDPMMGTHGQSIDTLLRVFIEEKVSITKLSRKTLIQIHNKSKDETVPLPQTMHTVIINKERLPEETMAYSKSRFKKVFLVYGNPQTQAAGTSLVGGTQLNLKPYHYQPLPFVEIKITDSNGYVKKRGEPGVVWFRGPYAYKGYLMNKIPEQNVDRNGWVHTEDAAIMDEDGKFTVVGQIRDVIRLGATETYPISFEMMIREIPDVYDVVVFGLPSDESHQDVCVCVILRPDANINEDNLHVWFQKFYKEHAIPHPPKYVLIMQDFPQHKGGEVDKTSLSILVMQHLGVVAKAKTHPSSSSKK